MHEGACNFPNETPTETIHCNKETYLCLWRNFKTRHLTANELNYHLVFFSLTWRNSDTFCDFLLPYYYNISQHLRPKLRREHVSEILPKVIARLIYFMVLSTFLKTVICVIKTANFFSSVVTNIGSISLPCLTGDSHR